MGWNVDKVGVFTGICLQVVKFRHVPVFGVVTVGIVDVLPVRGADSPDVGGVVRELFSLYRYSQVLLVIVFIEPRGAPSLVARLDQLHPGLALGLGQRGGVAEFEETGGEVQGEHLLGDGLWFFSGGEARVPDDERDADAGVMHGALVHHAVLAIEQAVVTHEDDHGVVELTALFQLPCERADAVVHAQDDAPIAVDHILEVFHTLGLVIGELFAPLEERAVDAVPGVEAVAVPAGLVFEVKGALGVGDVNVIKRVGVLLLRRVETMRCLVAEHEAPGFVVGSLDVVSRQLGDAGGVVPGQHLAFALDIEFGVEVLPLAFVRCPVVEVGALFVVVLAHVPLANIGRVVASLLKALGEAGDGGWEFSEIVPHAVLVGIHAAEDGGATGRAEGSGAEGVLEMHALFGQTVDVGRLQVGMSGASQMIPAKIVAENKQDIRLGRSRRCLSGGG